MEQPTSSTHLPFPPNPKAFIVDDSAATRRIFRYILEQIGITVDEAVNGQQALEMLKDTINEYCIIFSDISMPLMDGFEFCYVLQQAPWYNGIPFVLVSTESDAANVIKGLKLGADDFMPKPFDEETAQLVIARVLYLREQPYDKTNSPPEMEYSAY